MKSSSPVPSDRNSERWSPLLEPTRGDETEGYIGYSWLRNLRRKSGHVALSSNFRFRWCRSRTPIWTRATVHKWSNDRISTQTCHLLCNYVLSSSLLRFPLARLITVSCTFFLADIQTSLFSFLLLSMSSYRFAALVEEDSYRTVTRLPLNPSEWTVPPWRTYRGNFSPSPVRSTCSLKGGWKQYLSTSSSVPGCLCSFRDLFIARLGPLSPSTIPYGPQKHSFPRFYLGR